MASVRGPCPGLWAAADPVCWCHRDDQVRTGPSPLSRHRGESGVRVGSTDAEAGMLSAEASSAICVQKLDDSRNSAIHTKYRISLRSSSLREPRYPLLRVVIGLTAARSGAGALASERMVEGVCGGFVRPSERGGRASPCGGGGCRPLGPPDLGSRPGPALLSRGEAGGAGPRNRRRPGPLAGPRPGGSSGSPVGTTLDSMIPPQVHLRRPCYDFSFL